uniref:C2H2-type domain-containing protein n=1 Tax=Nothoprocta perdicaria TaxID=30464 RepID=A0A8C6ZWP7_NOTPE
PLCLSDSGQSWGFICPLCMKVCVTPTDLCEHYQNEHSGTERRRQDVKGESKSLQLDGAV